MSELIAAAGGVGGMGILILFFRYVLPRLVGGGAGGRAAPGIVITNTGSSAAADADSSGRHSAAPSAPRLPALGGLDQEITPTEYVKPSACEELRSKLEHKLEARSEKHLGRVESKLDGLVDEQRRMSDTLVRLTTLAEEAGKRDERYNKRLERVERRGGASA